MSPLSPESPMSPFDVISRHDSRHDSRTRENQPLLVFRAQYSVIVVEVVNPTHEDRYVRFEENPSFVPLFGFATSIILLGLTQCKFVVIDDDIATWVWGVYVTFLLHVLGGSMELNIKRTTGIDWVVFVCGANWLNSGVLTVLLQFDTISQTGEYGYSIPYIYLFLFAIDIVCAVWGFYAARVNDVISDIVDSPVLCFKHQDTSATFIVGSAWLLSGYASMTMALDLENAEELYGSVHIQCRYLLLFSAWLLFSSFRRNHFMDVLLFLLSFAGLFAWLVAFIDEPRLLYWQYASSLLYIVAGLVALGCACMICHDNARTRKHPVKWYSMVGIASYLGLGGYMVARTFT